MYTDQEKRQLIEMCKLTRKEDFLSGKSSQTADKVFGRKPKGFSLFMRENICCEE